MALELLTSKATSRPAQTYLTPEVQLPAEAAEYGYVDVSFSMTAATVANTSLALSIRIEAYDPATSNWEVKGAIDWVGGQINPKTGGYYYPSLADNLEPLLGRRLRASISILKTMSFGFKIQLT